MSINIFNIPQIKDITTIKNIGERTVMIHDLKAEPEFSTEQISIDQLLSFMQGNQGKITITTIDNGMQNPPDIQQGSFMVKANEIIIFKVLVVRNTFNKVDGYNLYLFNKGRGQYQTQGLSLPNFTTVDESDFTLIYESQYGDQIKPGYITTSDWNTMLSYTSDQFRTPEYNTVTQYIQRLFADGVSQLDTPTLHFKWGLSSQDKGSQVIYNPTRQFIDKHGNQRKITFGNDPENYPPDSYDPGKYNHFEQPYNLHTFTLGINISFWEAFDRLLQQGFQINLKIHRRRSKRRGSNSIPFTNAARWTFNKSASFWGGQSIIPIKSKMDWYDIHPEFLLQRRSRGNQVMDLKSLPNIKRANQKQLIGFSFEFIDPKGRVKHTPIIATLWLIERMGEVRDNKDNAVRVKIITYQINK